MKKLMIALIFSVLTLTGCSVIEPDPGSVAVIVDRPYFFGDGGVRDEVVQGGTRVYDYPSAHPVNVVVTPQQRAVRFDDFSSMDNILLDFESSLQYRITNAPVLVKSFGGDWFKNNIEAQYTAIVRDEIKKHSMTDIMSNVEVAAQIDKNVTERINELVQANKLPIEIINVSLGRARPNENVLEQMNKTAAEQQRVRTLVAAVEAENQRKLEQEAKAKADNAYRNALGLSPEQYLVREIAELNAQACMKAATCIVNPSSSSLTLPGR